MSQQGPSSSAQCTGRVFHGRRVTGFETLQDGVFLGVPLLASASRSVKRSKKREKTSQEQEAGEQDDQQLMRTESSFSHEDLDSSSSSSMSSGSVSDFLLSDSEDQEGGEDARQPDGVAATSPLRHNMLCSVATIPSGKNKCASFQVPRSVWALNPKLVKLTSSDPWHSVQVEVQGAEMGGQDLHQQEECKKENSTSGKL